MIDLVAIALILLVLQWIGDASVPSASRDPMVQGVIGWGVGLTYFPLFWWRAGATPGMRLLGLRLVGADAAGLPARRFVSRYIAWIVVQVVVLGVPFAFIFFIVNRLRRKPLWHDEVSGTRIVALESTVTVPVAPNASTTTTAGHVPSRPTTELGRETRRLNEDVLTGIRERLTDPAPYALEYCGSCGRPRDGASRNFCRFCGAKLPLPEASLTTSAPKSS